MRHLKLMLIFLLVVIIAMPALAGRRKPKKNVSALVSSIKIALNDNPPRYEEALGYLNEILETHGMVPEAYLYRAGIYSEYAESEYDPQKKLEHLALMAADYDSLFMACESDEVDKKYKKDCDEYVAKADTTIRYFWSDNFNKGLKILTKMEEDLLPAVANAADSITESIAKKNLQVNADSAISYFKIGTMVDGDNYRSFEGLGLIYDRLGEFDSSLAYFEKASELAPEEPNLIQSIAYSYIQRYDWENSAKYFRKLLPFVMDDTVTAVGTMFNMSICFNNMQMYDSSFIYNKKIIELSPGECDSYVEVGKHYLLQSQTYADSVSHYNQAGDTITAKKFVEIKSKTLDSCAFYFQSAIDCDSNNTAALEQGAIVDMIQGNLDRACPKFERLTILKPSVKDYWVYLGDCRIQQGEFESAIEPYEKYVELDSRDCDVWRQLESLYKSNKMPEKLKTTQAKIKELGCK